MYNGSLPVINYTATEYNAEYQNWCAIQDNRGVMYFGNTSGVLEFDGTNWQKITLPNNSIVSSLCYHNQIVFVGGFDEFGYLGCDSIGQLQYKSLSDKLPENTTFQYITKIMGDSSKVYFFSNDKMAVLINDSIYLHNIKVAPNYGYLHKDKLLIYRSDTAGLYRFSNGKTEKLPDSELLSFSETGVIEILPYSNDTLLIITEKSGFYLYNVPETAEEKKQPLMKKFPTEVSDFLKKNQLYSAEKIDDNRFAIGTLQKGIVIIDREGKFVRLIDKEHGIMDNGVLDLYHNKNNCLWAMLNNGISCIKINSTYTIYNNTAYNINELTLSFASKDSMRYLGTMHGIKYQSLKRYNSINSNYKFKELSGAQMAHWDMHRLNNTLLSAAGGHIYSFDSLAVKPVCRTGEIYTMYQSNAMPDYLLLGLTSGFGYVKYRNNENESLEVFDYQEFEQFEFPVWRIVEDNNGSLWLSTIYNGIFEVKPDTTDLKKSKFISYTTNDGLPKNDYNYVHHIGDKLLVATQEGLYQAVQTDTSDKYVFVPDTSSFGSFFAHDTVSIYQILHNKQGLYWILTENKLIEIEKKNGNIISADFNKFNEIPIFDSYQVIYEGNNVLLVSAAKKLFRVDTKKVCAKPKCKTLIRKVIINEDSVLFTGNYYDRNSYKDDVFLRFSNTQPSTLVYNIPYKYNSIAFEYTMVAFSPHKHYQFKLEGFDRHWSSWTIKTRKEYTNLSEGDYVFRVKTRNVFKQPCKESVFRFTVLPPWYRTWLAYVAYIIGLILLFLVSLRYYTRRLKKKNVRLEKIIKSRTNEIWQQKEKILQQAHLLEEKNQILQKLSIVARETDNAVLIFDKSLKLEWVNEGFTRLYGYTLQEYGKERGWRIIDTSNNPDIEKLVNKCLTSQESVIYESKMLTKSGEYLWTQTTLTPIIYEGKVEKLVAIDSDISRLKQAEIEIKKKNLDLERQRDKYQRLNETKNKFFSIIAHDLKNPFNSLIGLMDFIIQNFDELDSNEALEYMKKMLDLSKNTFNLLENLLQWSRTQTGSISFEPEEFDIQSIVTGIVDLFRGNLEQKNIRLSMNIPEHAIAFADKNMVQTIFRNLISNALKFSHNGGKIIISTSAKDEMLHISVTDNGVGISKDDQAKIFAIDRFHTTEGTSQEKGTGLGLIICRDFIKKNRGKLRVESEKGKGSSFIFTLPKAKS